MKKLNVRFSPPVSFQPTVNLGRICIQPNEAAKQFGFTDNLLDELFKPAERASFEHWLTSYLLRQREGVKP